MSDLGDFGFETDQAPPRFQPQHELTVPKTDNIAGWIGPIPNRNSYAFVKGSDIGDRLYDPEGHALHDSVLAAADRSGIQFVLVVEFDTGVVWEWRRREWTESLPKKIEGNLGPQTYAPLELATKWDGHADGLWIDEDVEIDEEPLTRAEDWGGQTR